MQVVTVFVGGIDVPAGIRRVPLQDYVVFKSYLYFIYVTGWYIELVKFFGIGADSTDTVLDFEVAGTVFTGER